MDLLQALFNIAGVAQWSDLETVSAEDLQRCFTINTIGPILVVQSLLNAGVLQDKALIANMTSKVRRISSPQAMHATAMRSAPPQDAVDLQPLSHMQHQHCHLTAELRTCCRWGVWATTPQEEAMLIAAGATYSFTLRPQG